LAVIVVGAVPRSSFVRTLVVTGVPSFVVAVSSTAFGRSATVTVTVAVEGLPFASVMV
jgi:hypothetical protein